MSADTYLWEKFKNEEWCEKHNLSIIPRTLIDRSALSLPTQSAAGPGDAIQISWILKNPSAETT